MALECDLPSVACLLQDPDFQAPSYRNGELLSQSLCGEVSDSNQDTFLNQLSSKTGQIGS